MFCPKSVPSSAGDEEEPGIATARLEAGAPHQTLPRKPGYLKSPYSVVQVPLSGKLSPMSQRGDVSYSRVKKRLSKNMRVRLRRTNHVLLEG